MALYPTTAWSYPDRVDLVNAVQAADVNTVYHEVEAMEQYLGLQPHVYKSGSYVSGYSEVSSYNFGTLSNRLNNLEIGLSTAYNSRVNTAGGSTVLSTSTTVGLTHQTSGTGNLINWNNTGGTLVTSITKDGWISAIDGGGAV
jgi:hypothetical protein